MPMLTQARTHSLRYRGSSSGIRLINLYAFPHSLIILIYFGALRSECKTEYIALDQAL